MMTIETPLTDHDYTPVEGEIWLSIKQFSIRIYATDEGVAADIFNLGREMEGSLASTYVFDSECVDLVGASHVI